MKYEVAGHLSAIAKLFKNPKLTLIIRNQDLPDGDVLMSDDDADLAIAAINRLKDRTP